MKVVNKTRLSTPVLRKVLHWWTRNLNIPGLKKYYPQGLRVVSGRTSGSRWKSLKGGDFTVILDPKTLLTDPAGELFRIPRIWYQIEGFWTEAHRASRVLDLWETKGQGLVQDWLKLEAEKTRLTPKGVREAKVKAVQAKLVKALGDKANWTRKSKLAKTKLIKYSARVKRYQKRLADLNKAQEANWKPFKELAGLGEP